MSLRKLIFLSNGLDSNAKTLIDNGGIIDGVQLSAVDFLSKSLKANGLFNLFHAIYPFVGGTAQAHKFNLINPIDSDSAFRLSFSGTVTHNSNGVTFDGSTGYANTFFIPSSNSVLNDEAMFFYSRTSSIGLTGWVDMGSAVTTTQRNELIARTSANNANINLNSITNGTGAVQASNSDGSGLFMGSRISSTDLRLYRNGAQIGSTATTANNGARSNLPVYIGARRVSAGANGFVARNFALAGMSKGLTPSQSLVFYNIVQQFQTILNRQI